MKTTALILLLFLCRGVWAQSSASDADTNQAKVDAALRRALHAAEANSNNATTNSALTNSAATNAALLWNPTNTAPAATNDQVLARRGRRNSTLPQTTNSVASSNAKLTHAGPASATNVIVAAASDPVVVTPATVAAGAPISPGPAVAPPATLAQLPTPGGPATLNPAPARPPTPTPGFPTVRSTAVQPPPIEPEQMVKAGEIDLSQATVDQLLDLYALLVNRTILKAPNLPAPQITLKTQTDLTKTEAIQACESILTMNGISMVNEGEKFVKAVPVANVGSLGAVFSTNDVVTVPEEDRFMVQIVHVKNAKPSELVPILTPFAQVLNNILAVDASGMLIIRDYARNVKRMMELIKDIDVIQPLEYDSEVIPIKYAKASDISSALSALGGNTAATIGPSQSTGPARGGSGGFTPGGAATGTLGSSGYPSPGATGSTAGSTGNQRTSSFNDRLKQLGLKSSTPGGQSDFNILGATKIIADERTNSLLVFANKQDMAMIKKIIAKLDTVLAQVLIDAIVMEVTLDKSQNVGVSYVQNQPSQPGNYFSGIGAINNGTFLNQQNFTTSGSNGLGALPSGFSYLAQFGNDFDATLTAIATDSRIHVLSRPRIQTSHAVPASLKIGDTVPYVTGTYFGGINGQASSQYQQTFVGIDLEVTPLINSEGLVVMDISEDIQQLGTPTIIDGNAVPTTTQRSAAAKVSVQDRDTIILGGFISTTKSRSKSGVPVLKDIPGLGYLFRSTADSYERVELIILIRPTVLHTPQEAALVATHEQAKLPNVKRAFAEDQADENKQIKAADRIQVPPERE